MAASIGLTIVTLFWILFGVIYGIWFITGIILAIVFSVSDNKKKALRQSAERQQDQSATTVDRGV